MENDCTKIIAVTTTLSHELGSLCSVPGFATNSVTLGKRLHIFRPQFSYSYDERVYIMRVSERHSVMRIMREFI